MHLQQIAVDIFSFCMTNSVSFQAQWIPRGDNELANYLSRIVDPDDWMLHPHLFKLITFKWGPFDVDPKLKGRKFQCTCLCTKHKGNVEWV